MQETDEPAKKTGGGPQTEAGKAASSLNAAKHWCTSEKLIVPGESQEEFDELLRDTEAEYEPRTALDHMLVMEVARTAWTLRRKNRGYDAIVRELYSAEKDESKWGETEFKRVELATRYRTTEERSFARAYRNVEHLRRVRQAATVTEEKAQQQKKKAAEEEKKQVFLSKLVPSGPRPVAQWITVKVVNAVTRLESVYPKLEGMQREVARAGPKARVCRTFYLPDGMPTGYEWLEQDGKWDEDRLSVEQWMDESEWWKLAEWEEKQGNGLFRSLREVREGD